MIRHLAIFKGQIASSTIRTTFALGARLLIQAGILLLVVRILDPALFGAFSGLAALSVLLGTMSSFGASNVLIGEVAKDPSRRNHVLSYSIPMTVLCGMLLFATYLAIYFCILRHAELPFEIVLLIGATEILLQPLFNLICAEHLGHGKAAYSQLLQLVPLVLRLAALLTISMRTTSDPLVAYSYCYYSASVAALAVALKTLNTPWPHMRIWRMPTCAEWRNASGYAALNMTYAGPSELDKTLAMRLLPLHASGLYSAAARVIGTAALPVAAMLLAALPRLFREGHTPNAGTGKLLRWIGMSALSYTIVVAAGLWFAASIIATIFGSKYEGVESAIRWLIPAIPCIALRLCAGDILMALGRPWVRTAIEASGMLLLLVASIGLIQHFGSKGMPVALSIAESYMAIIGWLAIYQHHNGQICRPFQSLQ